MGDELAALGVADRGGDGDFDAELVRPMGLALADALDLRRVQGIDSGISAAGRPILIPAACLFET